MDSLRALLLDSESGSHTIAPGGAPERLECSVLSSTSTSSSRSQEQPATCASVTFRKVLRSVLHPIGCVNGEFNFDRQSLFNHVVKSLCIDAGQATQELSRVNREPPPTFVLNVCVLKVVTPNDSALEGNVRIRFRTGTHDAVHSARAALTASLGAISENDELTENSARRTHRVAVGEQCTLLVEDQLMDEVRIDIAHQDGTDGTVNGKGRCFIPIRTLSSVGSVALYDIVDVDTQELMWRARILFHFEARGFVIDLGHHSDGEDDHTLFLSVCHYFVMSQLTEEMRSRPLPSSTTSSPPAAATPGRGGGGAMMEAACNDDELDSGYPSESELLHSSSVRLSKQMRVSTDSQIILDCLAMLLQIPQLTSIAYLTEAIFACSSQFVIPWATLAFNIGQLDQQVAQLMAVYGQQLPPADAACVRQCLLSIYNILLRHIGEKRLLFPPAVRSVDVQSVVKPLTVIDVLFVSDMWQRLVVSSDDGLGVAVQLTQSLEASARSWYTATVAVGAISDAEVEVIIPVCQALLVCLKQITDSYDRSVLTYVCAFEKLGIDYWKVCLGSLEELIHDDLQILAQTSCDVLRGVNASPRRSAQAVETCYELCQALFQLLESSIRLAPASEDRANDHADGNVVSAPDGRPRVHRLHMALEVLIPHWLETVDVYCKQCIASALTRDKVTYIADAELGISSSAQEFGNMVELLGSHWESAVEWPEAVVSYLIITQLMDIMCACSRQVSSHNQRCLRGWPPQRLIFGGGRPDYKQPLIALNNVAYVAERVRRVPRALHLPETSSCDGERQTSRCPSPACRHSLAQGDGAGNGGAFGAGGASIIPKIMAQASTDHLGGGGGGAGGGSGAITNTEWSPIVPRRSLELPPALVAVRRQFDSDAAATTASSGLRRSSSFKERKTPAAAAALGVAGSPPVVVRRTGSLRRGAANKTATSLAADDPEHRPSSPRRRPLSSSSPDLVLLGNSWPTTTLSAAVGAAAAADDERASPPNRPGEQRHRAVTRLVIDNCMRDLGTVLMQMGQQVMAKFAAGVDQPLAQIVAELPEANSDMDIGVVVAPLLDYVKTTVKLVGEEAKLNELAYEGLVRGLWNVINCRLFTLLQADCSTGMVNRKLLSNSLSALTMNEGVMSFFCRELGFSLRRSMLNTSPFLALKHYVDVKTASDDGLLLLFFGNIVNETDLQTGARIHVDLEIVVSEQPGLHVFIDRGERFDHLKSASVELESYIECSLLPMSVRLGGQELESYTSVAVSGESPPYSTSFHIPFRKGTAMKQRLLEEGVLVLCVRLYSGVTTMSGSEEFYHNVGVAAFSLASMPRGRYSHRAALPVLRPSQCRSVAHEFVAELEKRARLSPESAQVWRSWLPALRPS